MISFWIAEAQPHSAREPVPGFDLAPGQKERKHSWISRKGKETELHNETTAQPRAFVARISVERH